MMLIIALMVFVEVLKRRRRSYMVACEDALGGGWGRGEHREPGYNHTHDFRSKENNFCKRHKMSFE
jgi:hypothetical protein